MDPAKLKVVELRAELAALGLDTRGNKPVLVDRLRAALATQGQDVAETTIADTSTEDLGEDVGSESPPRTRRPGPASRTRRRQSSSEPPPTPTRSSRRDTETSKIIPPIEESTENQNVVTVEDSSDSNQECILSDVPKPSEIILNQSTSPVKQISSPQAQPLSVIKQASPIKLKESSPVKQTVSPIKLQETTQIEQEPSLIKKIETTLTEQDASSPIKNTLTSTETELKHETLSPIKEPLTKLNITPHETSPRKQSSTTVIEKTPEKIHTSSKIEKLSVTDEKTPVKTDIACPILSPLKDPTKEQPILDQQLLSDQKSTQENDHCGKIVVCPETSNESQQKNVTEIETKLIDDKEVNDSEISAMDIDTPSTILEVESANIPLEEKKRDDQDNERKSVDKHKDDDDHKKDKKKREKHSRWGNFHSAETTTPDNDVQVTGEYISIRDDDDDKGRSRSSRRSRKKPRAPSPRRKSPIKVPEPEIPKDKVTISWYDSDLNLHITVPEMNVAIPLTEGGFGHCWAGARSSHGVVHGKVCYEVRIESMLSPPEDCIPGIRFGWSTQNSSLHLGDSKLSWGFEHTGRKVNDCNFSEYGISLKEKDVIGVYVDFNSTPCTIFYTVNGENQGAAFEFDKEILEGAALYPHILSKNCCYLVNYGHEEYNLLTKTKVIKRQIDASKDDNIDFKNIEKIAENIDESKDQGSEKYDPSKCSDDEQEKTIEKDKISIEMEVDQPEKTTEDIKEETEQSESKQTTVVSIEVDGEEAKMLDGYTLIGKLPLENLVAGPQRPSEDEQCEVIMMCGLPGSGKTYWSTKYVSEHPEKRFNILGTNSLVEKMKIDCESFKTQFQGKWKLLISKVTKCVVKLIEIAQNRRRNYVLDQTNVYPSAQRRKMREFNNGYKRTAVIIVPDETTYEERQRLREEKDGKDVPDGAVLEMKANFVLPEKCSWLDEVIFAELDEEASKKLLEKYNKEGKAAGYNNNGSNGGSRRSHSAGGSRSSSGAPSIPKRSRFDNGSNDRGRYGGHDRGRHNIGPMRNRDTRRDRRGGGSWGGGRQGGWGGRDWSGPRDSYGRDHHPYGRDSYGRDQPYGRDRSRDVPPGPHPYRGTSDRWVNRGGGHRGREARGGIDSRGRGGIMDRGRSDGNDRSGNKSSWGQHRGGNASGGTAVGRNQQNQFARGPQRLQNSTGQSRGGGHSGGENQGTWGHQQSSSGGWGQQANSGNWQGGWNQQGWNSNWGNWGNAGGGGQWNKFHSQQQASTGQQQTQQQQQQQQQSQQPQAQQQQVQQQQQQQQQQQNQQGQWSQWGSWPAPQQQSYWASQWSVPQGYGTALTAANTNTGTVATQEKK